jgi:hypothetical protein
MASIDGSRGDIIVTIYDQLIIKKRIGEITGVDRGSYFANGHDHY